MAVISIISLISTLICGMWMRKQPAVDASSIAFHMGLGTFAVIAASITIIALVITR